MLVKEAAEEFGGLKGLSEVLGVHVSMVYRWGDELPEMRHQQLEGMRVMGLLPKKKQKRARKSKA